MTPGLLSIVIPAYNEEANVRAIYEAVRDALADLGAFEAIFVDDGSSDGTARVVRALRSEGCPVRLIRFGRNFGQQAALLAGIEEARGEAVITMDCDLQHPPDLLPRMVEAWRGGAKLVQMVRLETEGASLFKRVTSKAFYLVLNVLSETPVTSGAADYQLMDAAVVEAVLRFKDRQPFLRGLVSWLGFPSARIEYSAPARRGGKGGYSLRKMMRLSLHALTGLSSKPLRFSFYLGLLVALLSLTYAAFALVALIAGKTVPGWASVVVAVTLLGAVQLVSIGIVGEYIARIYEQARGVPRFVIVERDDRVPARVGQGR
jgi:polyisoprenyl-phosphate glycosyltransferase